MITLSNTIGRYHITYIDTIQYDYHDGKLLNTIVYNDHDHSIQVRQ